MSKPQPAMHANDANGWLKTRLGEHCLIRVPAADTGGIYSAVEIISQPGDATPLHSHRNEDEHLTILEGTATIALGDRVFDAKAGETVTFPRQVPHAWGNRSSSQLRIVVIATPGGVEEVLRIIAAGDVKDIPGLADRFGVAHHGPAPF